jgi:hypothetical protein
MSIMTRDAQDFALRVLSIPDWRTIVYVDNFSIAGEAAKAFRDAVRAYAYQVWITVVDKTDDCHPYFYLLESNSLTTAVVGCYVDSSNV